MHCVIDSRTCISITTEAKCRKANIGIFDRSIFAMDEKRLMIPQTEGVQKAFFDTYFTTDRCGVHGNSGDNSCEKPR